MLPDSHPHGGSVTTATAARAKLSGTLAMFTLLTVGASTIGCERAAPAPSVLLIVVDTLRADHVGALHRPASGETDSRKPT